MIYALEESRTSYKMNKHIEEERGNICKERGPHTSLRIPNYYGITSIVTFSMLKEENKKKKKTIKQGQY